MIEILQSGTSGEMAFPSWSLGTRGLKARQQKAREEAEKLMAQTEKQIEEAKAEARESEDSSFWDRIMTEEEGGSVAETAEDDSDTSEPAAAPEAPSDEKSVSSPDLPEDYENLIDERAFLYESSHLGLSMKVPANHWFYNFGGTENAIAEIGFADEPVSSRAQAKFMLRILSSDTPPETLTEKVVGDELVLEMPRDETSFFRMTGPLRFRDAMRSVLSSIDK